MLDAVVIRTANHELLDIYSQNSSNSCHKWLEQFMPSLPNLADLMTYKECNGDLDISKVAWIGDSNNVCNSYIEAAEIFNFDLNIYCPKGFEPNPEIMNSQKIMLS